MVDALVLDFRVIKPRTGSNWTFRIYFRAPITLTATSITATSTTSITAGFHNGEAFEEKIHRAFRQSCEYRVTHAPLLSW